MNIIEERILKRWIDLTKPRIEEIRKELTGLYNEAKTFDENKKFVKEKSFKEFHVGELGDHIENLELGSKLYNKISWITLGRIHLYIGSEGFSLDPVKTGELYIPERIYCSMIIDPTRADIIAVLDPNLRNKIENTRRDARIKLNIYKILTKDINFDSEEEALEAINGLEFLIKDLPQEQKQLLRTKIRDVSFRENLSSGLTYNEKRNLNNYYKHRRDSFAKKVDEQDKNKGIYFVK